MRTKDRIKRILKAAGRRPSDPLVWLAETSVFDGTVDSFLPGAAVRDVHKGSPRILFWATPSWYQYFVDKAWELEVRADSARNLIGLCIERQLARKSDKYWIEFFRTGSDIHERLSRNGL